MKILGYKSWRIFILMTVVPITIIIAGAIIGKLSGFKIIQFISALIALFFIAKAYFGWIWSVGTILNYFNKEGNIFSLKTFKQLFIIALLFSFILSPILVAIYKSTNVILLIRFLRYLSFFAFLLCIYFAAVNFNTVENNENNTNHSVFFTFLLIWFLPIGIWFLQPRLKIILGTLLKKQLEKKTEVIPGT